MTNKELPLPGFLITFEGGEGAGKSSLMESMAQELARRGRQIVKTREPGGSKLGEQIRRWLLDGGREIALGQRAELLLFLAARAQHLEELIRPALQAGSIVLCDRFNDSSVAYQGIARGLGQALVQNLCEQVCDGLAPDLTFFIDIDPLVGLERTKKISKENAVAGKLDRIEAEKLEFHENVRRAFHLLARENPDRICLLDGSKSQIEVYHDALRLLETRLLTSTRLH